MATTLNPIDSVILGTVVWISSMSWNDARVAWVEHGECAGLSITHCDAAELEKRREVMRYRVRTATYTSIAAFAILVIASALRRKDA